jgi:hypothetical protein
VGNQILGQKKLKRNNTLGKCYRDPGGVKVETFKDLENSSKSERQKK